MTREQLRLQRAELLEEDGTVRRRLHTTLGRIQALGDPQELRLQLQILEERRGRLQREYDAAALAAEALFTANSALQARFGDLSRIKYFPMDISLYDSTGRTKIADTSGISVNLTLPLPDELIQYAGNNKMAAISGGALEDLNARFTTVGGVPCINFTATHFSPYVIYVDTANLTEATIDSTPKTGDPIHPKWFLAIGMACISLVLFFKRDKVVVKTKAA